MGATRANAEILTEKAQGRAYGDRVRALWEAYGTYGVLVLVLLGGAISNPLFLTGPNLLNVARQSVALGIVAIGQTFVILTGGIDLGVGSVMTLANTLSSSLMVGKLEFAQPGAQPAYATPVDSMMVPAILVVLAVGLGIGLVNGAIITKFRVAPFIVTLGMMSVVQGVIFLYAPTSIGMATKQFRWVADGKAGPIPVAFIGFLGLAIIAAIVLRRTALGRHIYAVGGNEEVARLSGVKTNLVKLGVYAICGLSAAAAGLFLTSRMGSGNPLAGTNFELDSIAVVVIGGTSLFGGRGGIGGTIAGVFIIAILANILNLSNIDPFYQQVFKGAIIIAAVAIWTTGRRRTATG